MKRDPSNRTVNVRLCKVDLCVTAPWGWNARFGRTHSGGCHSREQVTESAG